MGFTGPRLTGSVLSPPCQGWATSAFPTCLLLPLCSTTLLLPGLRAGASWTQLDTPVPTLPPKSSLCWVSEQAVFLCDNRIRAGLTRVTEAQVVTTRTAETQLYISRRAIRRKVPTQHLCSKSTIRNCELGVAPHTSPLNLFPEQLCFHFCI